MLKKHSFIFILTFACAAFFTFFKPAAASENYALSGHIFCQKTGMEIKTGVTIKIDGKRRAYVTSNDGQYRIYLAPGKHEIVFSKTGYSDEKREIILENIVNHEFIKYMNIEMAPREKDMKISGVVYDRVTASVVGGANVTVNGEKTKTGDDGYFEAMVWPAEKVEIKIISAGHKLFKLKKAVKDISSPHRIYLERYTIYSKISGKVFEKYTNESVFNAIVEVDGTRAATDENGNFEILSLKSGKAWLKCVCAGYENVLTKVKLIAGDNRIKIYLKKKKAAGIEK